MKSLKKLIWMNVISLILFILILVIVKYKFITNLDLYVNSLFSSVTNNLLINLSKNINIIFDTTSMVVISLILAIFIFIKHSKRGAVFLSITMLTDALILLVLKNLFKIQRPISEFVTETDFSFPSGHVTTAVVFFGILSYLILKKYKNARFIILISIFSVLLIGFTRLYLGIHWFSDVLGGIFLGEFILTGSLIIKHILENGRS